MSLCMYKEFMGRRETMPDPDDIDAIESWPLSLSEVLSIAGVSKDAFSAQARSRDLWSEKRYGPGKESALLLPDAFAAACWSALNELGVDLKRAIDAVPPDGAHYFTFIAAEVDAPGLY